MKDKEFNLDNNSGEYYELSEGAYAYVIRGWLSDEEKNDYLVKIIKNGSCKRPETVLVYASSCEDAIASAGYFIIRMLSAVDDPDIIQYLSNLLF